MSIGWMLRRHREATLRILLGPTGLALGVAIYALGFLSYRPGWSFTCTDGLVGMGLFAISAQIARGLLLVPGLARPLVWVGLTSYGVYLLHQPYLNFAAERLRELPLGRIVPMGLTLLGLVTLGSGLLEKLVDRATKRVIG
jgi:peptidoglycan/LPS O-acetylase OafA/YrhL